MTQYEDEKGSWTNVETQCVNHWLVNDEIHQHELRSLLNGGQLEDYVNDLYHDMQHVSDGFGMFHALIDASLSKVNWREIVEADRRRQNGVEG
ncbi:hypothetical protein LCGC14_1076320 [marine sediment metagenome]|uniref:Uncharacterized protein n=1 Tax=marine sediment metagenome TaxID=412755 RepID=A0A0F9QMG6_9ZZZZ